MQATPSTSPAPTSAIDRIHCSEIEFEEHQEVLNTLRHTKEFDLGQMTLRVGHNALNYIVMLIETMEGRFAVVNALP